MSKKEIFKYLIEANSSISIYQVVLSLMTALILGLFMYFVYRKTHTGVVYSKEFNQTLVLVAIIITMVMTIIGGNLALSLGMVGSLSVIRFRTAIKEPKDMAFLFWAIAIGLSCGAEMYVVAAVGSLVIAVVLFFFRNDAYDGNAYLLVVRGNALNTVEMEQILNKNSKKWKLRMHNISETNEEITYEVKIRGESITNLAKQLQLTDAVELVNVVTYTGEIVN